ncbi:DMT family transporter [Virgibacillus sp. C22-A2]|uniref:DMT family transporter n=1 Tax=Virgibacillus tibetensis TaxID=3042313 RepID=A0ABU6KFU8_9BACI|nr:DMT family transporter [Virgibacillus sp. C22-A2]
MGKHKGILFVLIGAASFGFTPIFAKLGFSHGYSLGQLNIVQMIISCFFLWGITLSKRTSFKGLTQKNVIQILITGTMVGLTSIFYYGSIQYLPASLAIILLFQFVWIGIIFEWLFSKVKPTIVTLVVIVIILTGVFFASNIIGGTIRDLPLVGFVFGVLAAFTYACFIFFSGKVATTVNPWVRSSLMVSGSVVLVFLIFIKDVPSVITTFDGKLWLIAAGVGLFGAVLPPLFFALGAYLISGGLANILSSIELPIAIISASIILSETITPLQWLGTILIILAIILNELGSIQLKRKYDSKKPHQV